MGRAIRALRHRAGWRQLDLASRARVSQSTVSLIERGGLDLVTIRTLRHVIGVLGASHVHEVRWHGGRLDYLMDERHAAIVDAVAKTLSAWGWHVEPEVSYSEYGERGSIDLLAWHEPTRTLLVIEVKSQLGGIEVTIRKLDEKARLAQTIAVRRFGWRSLHTARLLVLPEGMTARRQVERHAATFERAFPVRGRRARAWLRRPSGGISGIWFLSLNDGVGSRRRSTARLRSRRAGRSAA